MRPNKILNLSALALDAISACLLAYFVFSFLAHTLDMLDKPLFEGYIRHQRGTFNDFRSYYAIGKIAVSDKRADVLSGDVQKQFYCKVSTPAGATCEDYSQIPYAPFFALAMIPFACLPLNVSYVAWSLTGVLAFTAFIVLLGLAKDERRSLVAPAAIALGALASMPALRCLILGQSSLIVASLIALFFACWMRGYERAAGVVMALATFKLQFFPYTFIPAFAQRKWKILLWFAIGEALLWGVSIGVLGVKPALDFVSSTARMGSSAWSFTFTMLCMRSLYSYLPHSVEIVLSIVTCLAGIGGLYWLWKTAPELGPDRRSCWLIATTIVLSLLTSIYSQLYDIVMLAIAAALTFEVAGTRNLCEGGLARKAWWLILFTYPMMSWIMWVGSGRANPWTYHWSTLVLIVLAALVLSLTLRLRATSQASQADAESLQ